MEGFVKLHRRMVEWEWYEDHKMTRLFIHLILTANHAPKAWRGMMIERGQKVTSLPKLSAEAGFTIKQIRGLLDRLERTGEVTRKGTRQFTLLTLCNYDTYQSRDTEKGTQKGTQTGTQKARKRADEGQTKGRQRATNKNDKNDKNEKKEEVMAAFAAELASLSRPEHEILIISAAWGKWLDHRIAKKWPISAAIAKRDAGRCCGYRTQQKKITPPRPFVPASVLADLLDAAVCADHWKDWFYDDAVKRAISGGEDDTPRAAMIDEVDPFGNGGLSAEVID